MGSSTAAAVLMTGRQTDRQAVWERDEAAENGDVTAGRYNAPSCWCSVMTGRWERSERGVEARRVRIDNEEGMADNTGGWTTRASHRQRSVQCSNKQRRTVIDSRGKDGRGRCREAAMTVTRSSGTMR